MQVQKDTPSHLELSEVIHIALVRAESRPHRSGRRMLSLAICGAVLERSRSRRAVKSGVVIDGEI